MAASNVGNAPRERLTGAKPALLLDHVCDVARKPFTVTDSSTGAEQSVPRPRRDVSVASGCRDTVVLLSAMRRAVPAGPSLQAGAGNASRSRSPVRSNAETTLSMSIQRHCCGSLDVPKSWTTCVIAFPDIAGARPGRWRVAVAILCNCCQRLAPPQYALVTHVDEHRFPVIAASPAPRHRLRPLLDRARNRNVCRAVACETRTALPRCPSAQGIAVHPPGDDNAGVLSTWAAP